MELAFACLALGFGVGLLVDVATAEGFVAALGVSVLGAEAGCWKDHFFADDGSAVSFCACEFYSEIFLFFLGIHIVIFK